MPLGPLVKTPRRIPFIAILSTSRSELSKHRDDDRERHRRCRRGATHLRDNRWFGNRFGEDSLDHLLSRCLDVRATIRKSARRGLPGGRRPQQIIASVISHWCTCSSLQQNLALKLR